MKQLIIIILLAGGGYYLYNNGFLKIFKDMKISPKEFVADVKTAAAESVAAHNFKPMPQRAPERSSGSAISRDYFSALEKAAFASKDSQAVFSLVEIAFNAGLVQTDALISRYLITFTKAEEKNRVLDLASRYKDKDSLNMLNRFFRQGTFPRGDSLASRAEEPAVAVNQ